CERSYPKWRCSRAATTLAGVLMTALAAGLALVPIALGIGMVVLARPAQARIGPSDHPSETQGRYPEKFPDVAAAALLGPYLDPMPCTAGTASERPRMNNQRFRTVRNGGRRSKSA